MVKVIVSVTSHPSGACFIYRYITKYQCMLSVLTIQLKNRFFLKPAYHLSESKVVSSICTDDSEKTSARFRKICTNKNFFCTKNNQNLFIFKYQDDKNYSKDDIIR